MVLEEEGGRYLVRKKLLPLTHMQEHIYRALARLLGIQDQCFKAIKGRI